MAVDRETLDAYADRVDDYAKLVNTEKPGTALKEFIALLPKGARVLDLGCGPAKSSYLMRQAGLRPDPMDASPEMVTLANTTYGIGARVATFDEIDAQDEYHGVWANFSLLHAPRADMPGHLARLHCALKPGGQLHLGLKLGTGEGRDTLGRFYTYYGRDELTQLLFHAGFTVTKATQLRERGLAGNLELGILIRAHA